MGLKEGKIRSIKSRKRKQWSKVVQLVERSSTVHVRKEIDKLGDGLDGGEGMITDDGVGCNHVDSIEKEEKPRLKTWGRSTFNARQKR